MPGSPLPLERMRMPSSMPAGILTCRVLLRRMRPTPSQAWRGSVISLPLPWQVGQVCCTLKKPCCMRTAPGRRRCGRSWARCRAWRPSPCRCRRVFPAGHADLGVETGRGLLQRDFQRVFQIGAAVDLRAAAATAATAAAEDLAEDVAERIGEAAAHAAAHARGIGIDAGVAIAVVGGALLLVAQDFISLFGFLEFLFGFLAVRIAVRMVLHGQLTIGLLQFVVRGVLRHAQDFVIVTFCHDRWARKRAFFSVLQNESAR